MTINLYTKKGVIASTVEKLNTETSGANLNFSIATTPNDATVKINDQTRNNISVKYGDEVAFEASKTNYSTETNKLNIYQDTVLNLELTQLDNNKLLNWINIPQNIDTYYGGDGDIYADTDYYQNSEHYLEFYCCPKLGPNYARAYKDSINFWMYKPASYNFDKTAMVLNLNRSGSTLRKNFLTISQSDSSNYSTYTNTYNVNANTITYEQWYKIGCYQNKIVVNDNLYTGTTSGTYRSIINASTLRLFSYGANNDGFEGKFSYLNVYEDITKSKLLHSYKPYLTTENKIIIKDVVENKVFNLTASGGTLANITYELA